MDCKEFQPAHPKGDQSWVFTERTDAESEIGRASCRERVDTDIFIFLGSKISVTGDCSHEIKVCLLLERKAMKNLDSVLKSRGVTLPTKVCLVKAVVFPVVTYRCESWTVKKAKC